MNESHFRDYHLLLDQQPGVGGTARFAKHAERAGGEYPQNLAAGDDDNARGADVRRSLYDQGPIVGELLAGTGFQVRHRNGLCLSIEIDFDWRTAMRGPCVND